MIRKHNLFITLSRAIEFYSIRSLIILPLCPQDITTRKANARKMRDDNVTQMVHPHPYQALVHPIVENVTHALCRSTIIFLSQARTTQANKEVVALVNPNGNLSSSKVRDFEIMTPQ